MSKLEKRASRREMTPLKTNFESGVILLGFEYAHEFFVDDLLAPIGGDVLILDDKEGVGALDLRACAG